MQQLTHPIEQKSNTAYAGEADLVRALKAGDQAAYAELVERYSATVYNLALRITGDHTEAEEVLQETFLSAFRAVDRFEGRSQLGTWLYRIAYNATLMRLRKHRLPTVSIDEPVQNDEGDSLPRQLVDWTALPDEMALSGELHGVLSAAVATLPETLRSVFVLRDIEGVSTAEVAKVLSLTETNVKVRLHRARLALRERLSPYFALNLPGARTSGEGRGVAYVRGM